MKTTHYFVIVLAAITVWLLVSIAIPNLALADAHRGVDVGLRLGRIIGVIIGAVVLYRVHPALGILTFIGGVGYLLK